MVHLYLAVLAGTAAAGWVSEVIEPDCQLMGVSLVLDSGGAPHVAYTVGYTDPRVMYAFRNGTVWEIDTLATGWSIGPPSIDIDALDRPHIAYGYMGLSYSYWDGAVWHTEMIDNGGNVPSLVVDDSGQPHVSYYVYSQDTLRYASREGSIWDLQSVFWPGRVSSLSLMSPDTPCIAFWGDLDPGWPWESNLLFASYDGFGWQLETADPFGRTADVSISMQVDSQGNPHVSYYDAIADDLRYAVRSGSTWQLEAVESTGDVGRYSSLALDPTGSPCIAYQDSINNDIRYAWHNLSGWQVGYAVPGRGPIALDIDGYGTAHVIHSGDPDGLMYSRETSTATEEGTGAALNGFVLHPVSPNPAVGSFTARFDVPRNAEVAILVYNLAGRLVQVSPAAMYAPGTHQLLFSDMPAGVHICMMVYEGNMEATLFTVLD